MNGEMDPSSDPVWPQDDMLKLLEVMKVSLPPKEVLKYSTTESHLDWEKVAFNSYTAQMCKTKWMDLKKTVRKFRTLTELIFDAQDFIKNPYKGSYKSKKPMKHPDLPKKPLTPYFRFFMEKRAKYAKLHPEMTNLDLTKILSKKYNELPEKKKKKYDEDYMRDKETFKHSMLKFTEEHPDLVDSIRKKDVPDKPLTPQQLWFNHEKKAFLKTSPDASTKYIKDTIGKQWIQLSDKKRLKWIGKSLELQKQYEEMMREYIQQHPELNMTQESIKSTLTKAERHLKDKSEGRPDKPPSNGYCMFCAELMSSMKDVRSTERMVICSQQWKLLKQSEKDAYQKRCEQRKKEYEVEMNRFLCSLSEEEQQRVLAEQKKMGIKKGSGGSSPASKKKGSKTKGHPEKPKRPVSAMFIFAEEKRPKMQAERPDLSDSELTRMLARMWNDLSDKKKEKYKNLEVVLKAESEKVKVKEERLRLPETPKTAQDIWQQSVIGDYLVRFKNDRPKAQKAMEATWNTMEKKEKIMWIKKAAEDQKRYDRELTDLRSPATIIASGKKMKFEGEPKKPPSNGYQKFSQEMLSNGELNRLPMKERMTEIGGRWQKLPQKDKDRYKKIAEEKQRQYKGLLETWLASLSSQERATYKEYNSQKRKSSAKPGGPNAKVQAVKVKEEDSEDEDEDDDEEEEEKASSEADSSSAEESGEEEEDDDDDDDNDNNDGEEDDDDDDDDDDDEEAGDKENKSGSSSSESSSNETSDSDSD